MPIKSELEPSRGVPVCVVTTDIAVHDLLQETSASMVALAQRLALAGNDVTLLWISGRQKTADDAARSIKLFLSAYNIKLEVFRHADENVHQIDGPEYQSYGVYRYLTRNEFETVYFPLEHGLAYYTLLGKETGVYRQRPRLVVIAHAPLEWAGEADRFLLGNAAQIKLSFMERYCAQQADKLVSLSSSLLGWFQEKGWLVARDTVVLPALAPMEWLRAPVPEVAFNRSVSREVVLLASSRFRDGMTLFCDMLDELTDFAGDLRITMIGEFGRILGEHTGGMLIRRGRLWRFPIRLMPKLSLLEGISYAKQHGGIAVIPNFANASGYCVSECIRLGVAFIATSVGGNTDRVAPASAAKCLAEPTAASLASTLIKTVESPPLVAPRWNNEAQERLWIEFHGQNTVNETKSSRAKAKRKKPPLVSVVVTHHDRPQYLMQAIAALKDQDYPNIEVILVDDGSKLAESRVALDQLEKDFGKRDWKIIRSENKYVGAARNIGVRASRGELIILHDDDNALFPEAVTTFVEALESSQSDVCMALAKSVYQSNIPGSSRYGYVTYIPLGGCLELSLLENVFGDTISIYRRNVFDKAGFQLEKRDYRVEDWEFFIRLTLAGLKLRLIPEALFWYRISTQARYRSSHYYNNLIPIIETFAKNDFKGLQKLYPVYVSQNINQYKLESAKLNLWYSPSDEQHWQLTTLEPNAPEAMTLLARIAAGENREDTAVSLLAQAKESDFSGEVTEILETQTASLTAVEAAGASLSVDRRLASEDLLALETWTSITGDVHPSSYVEKPDRFFLETTSGGLSVAVLRTACPASTTSVLSAVSLQQAESDPLEFLVLLCPMHMDPVLAASSALRDRQDGSSGWAKVSVPFKPKVIEARLSAASSVPMNLVLAVRAESAKSKPVLGCFSGLIVRTSIEDRMRRRPRLGPPPHKLRARPWTEWERRNARLTTNFESDLPLLLFPKELEGGIFLRPSTAGPVVAAIERGFPEFAREIWAKVEIAHDEASAFDFAMALTLPQSNLTWRDGGPKNAVAFSGWIRVEEKFKLHDIKLRVREQIPTPLTISIAVRLPRGAKPNPSNAFWRSLTFFWGE